MLWLLWRFFSLSLVLSNLVMMYLVVVYVLFLSLFCTSVLLNFSIIFFTLCTFHFRRYSSHLSKFCLGLFFLRFLVWTNFKVFIEFVTILLLFYVFVFWPWGMWDLSSPTRDWTHTPCIGRQSLNHWTAREVPVWVFYCMFLLNLLNV